MSVTLDTCQVRDLVCEVFREYGTGASDLAAVSETLLIQDGRYFGRSYRAGGLMAMLLPEVGLLQFYGADGVMLRTINLLAAQVPASQAA